MIVTNCDIVIQADLAELVTFHTENNYDLTLVASLKDYKIPYGVCELEKGGSLARIREKPQYSFLVNTGMYVVRRDRLNLIPENAALRYDRFHRELEEGRRKRWRLSRLPRMPGSIQGNGPNIVRRLIIWAGSQRDQLLSKREMK